MIPEKANFIELCIRSEALRFGEFKLKSGRVSPYFFNAGRFDRGALLGEVARHYAQLLAERVRGDFMLFGPAYKGIALAAAVAVKLADDHGRDVGYAFNRKEAKDHGEGGDLVGAPLRGKVVIVDDVITAGTSVRESVGAIQAAGASAHAAVIALDRAEIADADDSRSATQQVVDEHGIAVHAIISLRDLIDYLRQSESAPHDAARAKLARHADAINAYRDRYGVG
ncbi:MAG: orotate phosphoribosyltransferase [bacterium]